MDKHVVIIGAGPGGLTAGMLLAKRGFRVTIFEKDAEVGGRNKSIRLGQYVFDTGPTFLMLKGILDEVFEDAGVRSDDYLTFRKLEPMYTLQFGNGKTLSPTTDHEAMLREIGRLSPGREAGFGRYLAQESERFERLYKCLQKPYGSPADFLSREFRRALPRLSLGKSLMGVLTDYFGDEQLALAFTFQAKYLGMSPWECPGAFTMISYIEHAFGIYHTEGGLSCISQAMAAVVRKHGGTIHLSTPVKQVIVENRIARGVELASGERVAADDVIINADFGYAMSHLFGEGVLRKYTRARLDRMRYSCSTYMLYLGLDTCYDMPHHAIVFADDYKRNVADIFGDKRLSRDTSFYVRNASVTDATLAPKGHSALYVLVPVANATAATDWERESAGYRDLVLETIERKTAMKDLRRHIVAEKVLTPLDWLNTYNVFKSATFNLAHNLAQMLYFRPHNAFEDVGSTYIVGGGTHPGSGLPTIYESARITADLVGARYGLPRVSAREVGAAPGQR
jgi:phytoene desaturase